MERRDAAVGGGERGGGEEVSEHLDSLQEFIPLDLKKLRNLQTEIPRVARDPFLMSEVELATRQLPSVHKLFQGDARLVTLDPASVHLVVTSPPYWTLKSYPKVEGQLGIIQEYERFLDELDKIWRRCFEFLVPGGRLICVVGDVCLSRRKNNGTHSVVALHAAIQERFRKIGYINLAPIIWYKISNAKHEVNGSSSYLGKPYEPNGVIKNDIEYILMQKKPGGYRSPSNNSRILSIISEKNHKLWFKQIWTDITGASTRIHPAPFPVQIAERLIRMFSFVGDTVLDPFMGTGSTNLASAKWGRNSIGIEIDPDYFSLAASQMQRGYGDIFGKIQIETEVLNPNGSPRETAKPCDKAILVGEAKAEYSAKPRARKT